MRQTISLTIIVESNEQNVLERLYKAFPEEEISRVQNTNTVLILKK